MTLYELIRQISAILTPETGSFYDYVIKTSDDDGGFLRTRFCYRRHLLEDREIAGLSETVVCFQKPFTEHYTDDGVGTLVKLQLDYEHRRDFSAKDFAAWSLDLGYRYAYLFDLTAKTYRVEAGPERRPLW